MAAEKKDPINLEDLAARVEKLSISELLTVASVLACQGREELAEPIAKRACDLITLKKLLGGAR